MRHGKRFNHLGRKKGHREAMLNNMASSLIIHKRIFTTTAKAKALRKFVEPLITKSKDNTTHSRRVVFSYLQDKTAVDELYTVVAPKVGDRPGGYTRILKTHNRLGDNAEMCMMELVDFNEMMLEAKEKSSKAKAGKRTRRGKKPAAAKAAAPAVEDVKEEVEAKAEEVIETTEEVAAEATEEVVEDTVEEVKAEAEEVVEEATEDAAEQEEAESTDEAAQEEE
ncbi:MAG: 50S ribosomal protein L17 [Bacteroidia bacterium]